MVPPVKSGRRIPGRLPTALFLGAVLAILAVAAPARAYMLYGPSDVSDSGSVSPTATSSPADPSTVAPSSATYSEVFGGGGGHNVVEVHNQTDGRLTARGRVQVNHIPAPAVAPLNDGYAFGSCTNCQTFAVALQINLYDQTATQVVPENYAVAINDQCNGCTTAAWAIQYDYPVADPDQVPADVTALVREMNEQLRAIQQDGMTLDQAKAQIDAVINQFQGLAGYLHEQRQESTDVISPSQPTPLPTTTAAPTPTAVATADTAAASPAPADTPGETAGAAIVASPTATAGIVTPSPSPVAPTATAPPAASPTATSGP